jgi:hypothetical protein
MPEHSAEYVVGFTGTRDGMTADQAGTVMAILDDHKIVEAHHGDCVGADADFDGLCRRQGVLVIVHPPSESKLRAYCESAVKMFEQPYLTRNRAIVDVCDLLIATPKDKAYRPNGRPSGTWYTIQYARSKGKKVVIVWPDGSTQIDGSDDGR